MYVNEPANEKETDDSTKCQTLPKCTKVSQLMRKVYLSHKRPSRQSLCCSHACSGDLEDVSDKNTCLSIAPKGDCASAFEKTQTEKPQGPFFVFRVSV